MMLNRGTDTSEMCCSRHLVRPFTLFCIYYLYDEMFRVENWASTWANHVSGSFGQNGGSLREVALTAGGTEAPSGLDITSGSPMWSYR